MKTQCPACQKLQDIPDAYKGRKIKCTACKQPFEAIPFLDIIVSQLPPDPPAKPPSPPKLAIYTPGLSRFLQVIAVIWFIGAIMTIISNSSYWSYPSVYVYKDSLWRDMYEQIIEIRKENYSTQCAIQALLSIIIFCLVEISIAIKSQKNKLKF